MNQHSKNMTPESIDVVDVGNHYLETFDGNIQDEGEIGKRMIVYQPDRQNDKIATSSERGTETDWLREGKMKITGSER